MSAPSSVAQNAERNPCASNRWRSSLARLAIAATLLFASVVSARADNNNFDLLGPRIEMKVSRNGKSLPISQVANLQPGDRLWLHPDFPDDQSARYLLIVAFLRGATNPPPETLVHESRNVDQSQ